MKTLLTTLGIILLAVTFAFTQTPTKADLTNLNIEMVKLFNAKKYDEALPVAQKAVNLSEQLYGKEHLETAKNLRNLGYVYVYQNKRDEAEKTFEKAFAIYEKVPDLSKQDATFVAEMLEVWASIKYAKSMFSAEKLYKTALVWREKAHGKDAKESANALAFLGNIYYWQKAYKKAAESWKKVADLDFGNLDKANSMVVVSSRYACALRKLGDKNGADSIIKNLDLFVKKKDADFINSGVINGKAINLAKPVYPDEAKQARAEGEVKVEVVISESGKILSACAVSAPHVSLIEATEIAAYQSTFTPTTLNGEAVKVSGTIIYHFVQR